MVSISLNIRKSQPKIHYNSPELDLKLENKERALLQFYYSDDKSGLKKEEFFDFINYLFVTDEITPYCLSFEGLCWLWKYSQKLKFPKTFPIGNFSVPLKFLKYFDNFKKGINTLNLKDESENINLKKFKEIKRYLEMGRVYQVNFTEKIKLDNKRIK